MVEKVIVLEDIPLTDFLGVQNTNIKELSEAFPNSKIVSRGNEIFIKGRPPEILRINNIINSLIEHYNKYGQLNDETVKSYLSPEEATEEEVTDMDNGEVIIYGTKGTPIKPRTKNQHKLIRSVIKNDLVFAVGPAGTGKTYVSVALAVRALKNKEVNKIIITRPAVEAGENLGYLPGDMQEKIDPYLRPIYDALDDMVPPEKLNYYMENRIIEIAPLAYMRGRTLNNAFVLLDEAQNTTMNQIKMFLTRMGPSTKIIITGDRSQVDLPKNQKSGLIEALQVLKGINGIGTIVLDSADVMRHKLVKSIIHAFEEKEQKKNPPRQGGLNLTNPEVK